MINKTYLRECVDYNQYTGIVTWKERPRNHFKTSRGFNTFNSQRSGKVVSLISGNRRYHVIYINKKPYYLHRIIWMYVHDEWPRVIDHINGNGFDNRICNLRSVNQSDNLKNSKKRSDNKSGATGVSWSKAACKWVVRIKCGDKCVHFGCFTDLELASLVAEEVHDKYGYHKNHGR